VLTCHAWLLLCDVCAHHALSTAPFPADMMTFGNGNIYTVLDLSVSRKFLVIDTHPHFKYMLVSVLESVNRSCYCKVMNAVIFLRVNMDVIVT
jgi:hypothetical protein